MRLPAYLYRGDNDADNVRKLRGTINSGLILTNLTSGGKSREILSAPLIESIKRHVGTNWRKTHFLSFSEDENIAIKYGSKEYQEYQEVEYSYDQPWDFATLIIDTAQLDKIEELREGLFIAYYPALCSEFFPKFRIALIDVIKYLTYNGNKEACEEELRRATRDKEWLILPVYPFEDGGYRGGLDTNCISYSIYKFISGSIHDIKFRQKQLLD